MKRKSHTHSIVKIGWAWLTITKRGAVLHVPVDPDRVLRVVDVFSGSGASAWMRLARAVRRAIEQVAPRKPGRPAGPIAARQATLDKRKVSIQRRAKLLKTKGRKT